VIIFIFIIMIIVVLIAAVVSEVNYTDNNSADLRASFSDYVPPTDEVSPDPPSYSLIPLVTA
jgi:hypothetical protein